MALDISKANSPAGLFPRQLSSDIFAKAGESSVIMRSAPRINLPTNGLSIPVFTGSLDAEWVDETGVKPVKTVGPGIKTMDPKKIAVIVPFSQEFVRDLPAYYNTVRDKMADAFGRAFDLAALGVNAPAGFGKLIGNTNAADNAPVVTFAPTVEGVTGVLQTIVDNGYDLTSWVLAKTQEPGLLAATDNNDRPLLQTSLMNDRSVPALLGRPIDYTRHLAGATVSDGTNPVPVKGVAGEWSQAAYGVAVDINYSVSDQATLELANGDTINLWQRNMVAVRAEAEFGFVVGDPKAFAVLR
ncbi:phage major capsid protein [Kribbella sp. WER1]